MYSSGISRCRCADFCTGFPVGPLESCDLHAIGGPCDRLDVPTVNDRYAGVRVEEGGNPKLTVSEITPLEAAQAPLPRALRIRVPLETATESTVDALHALFSEKKGPAKVLFDVERQGDFMAVMEAEGYNVLPDRYFMIRVEELCGRGSVRIID